MNQFKRIICYLAFVLSGIVFFSCESTPKTFGGDEKLLYNEATFREVRSRIKKHDWALRLYETLRDQVKNNVPQKPFNYSGVFDDAMWAKDAAIYYRISGDETYIPVIRDLIIDLYKLDQPDIPLYNSDPKRKSTHFWEKISSDDCRMVLAYDLVKNHPALLPYRELMDKRMDEKIAEAFRYESQITRLGNTQFWGVTGLGIYGFMRGNTKAIQTAIDGKYGFKSMLAKFRDDGRFWPEPKNYNIAYVNCCLILMAEMAKFNGWPEDLYAYTDPDNGANIRRLVVSIIQSCTPEGYVFGNGESSESANFIDGKLTMKRTGVFNPDMYRVNIKLPVFYHAYRDPVIGWAMSKFPDNDEYCSQFWGHSALLYGGYEEGDRIECPDARSVVYQEMGDAFIHSDETPAYWEGNALSLFFRNGASQQFHGVNDHLSFALNKYGKNLYSHFTLGWDYLSPRPGRGNETPLSQNRINQNSVAVDFKEPSPSNIHLLQRKPENPGVLFSAIKRTGGMQVISAGGEVYDGVLQKRTFGVVDDYVIDIFSVRSDRVHTYDYTLHSWGNVRTSGIGAKSGYQQINREYGFGPIDVDSRAGAENVWLANTEKAKVTDHLTVDFLDKDQTGICVQLLNNDASELIISHTPVFVQKNTLSEKPKETEIVVPARKPMIFIRRKCQSTDYILLHQPYKEKLEQLRFTRERNVLTIESASFTDCYNIETEEYRRELK